MFRIVCVRTPLTILKAIIYYAVCVQKDGVMVGHLMLGKTGRFAKIIFYFLEGHTNWKSSHMSCVGKDKRLLISA